MAINNDFQIGNSFDSQTLNLGHAKKVWRRIDEQLPGGYHVTNIYRPELTSVTVRKVWEDNNNKLRLRPKMIRVFLSNGMTVILSEANGWTATVDNLPTRINGKPVVYTWKEQQVLGYRLTEMKTDGQETVLTNSLARPNTPPPGDKKRKTPGNPFLIINDYGTPLGINVIINHVGDCFD